MGETSARATATLGRLRARWPKVVWEVQESISGHLNVRWVEGPSAGEVEGELGAILAYAYRETRLYFVPEECPKCGAVDCECCPECGGPCGGHVAPVPHSAIGY